MIECDYARLSGKNNYFSVSIKSLFAHIQCRISRLALKRGTIGDVNRIHDLCTDSSVTCWYLSDREKVIGGYRPPQIKKHSE
jgi:hypothetical protein